MTTKGVSPGLLELREEIARLDRSVVMLLAARQDAMRRLSTLEGTLGLGPTGAAGEARVIARARRWARDVGASPDDAENVFARLNEIARASAVRGHRARRGAGVVTVLLSMPPALPNVRVERSSPLAIADSRHFAPGKRPLADPVLGPWDDHRVATEGRRARPAPTPGLRA